jgi:hypothetical protein
MEIIIVYSGKLMEPSIVHSVGNIRNQASDVDDLKIVKNDLYNDTKKCNK